VVNSRPPLNLEPPRPRRWPLLAVLASIALHGVLLFSWIEGRLPLVPPLPRQVIVLPPPAEPPRAVPMPYRVPRAEVALPPAVREPRRLARARPAPAPAPARARTAARPAPADTQSAAFDTSRAVAPAAPRGAVAQIGPDYAHGLLWVRPLPLPPRELAQRLRKSQAELVDSAVSATIQAFLDSVAREPGADRATLPAWTTEVAGKKVGLDGKWLYLGGLKIPAAVLALLPISGGTNQQRAFDRTNDLLTDLRLAATRAATVDEFKQAIRDLRRQKQEEREFERNRRTPPPPELRSPPPAPPAATQPVARDTTAS